MKISLALVVLLALSAQAAVNIRMHPQVEIDGDRKEITLGDIADIQGEISDVRFYSKQVVATVPELGESHVYKNAEVSQWLRRIERRGKVIFSIPKSVAIENVGYKYSPSIISNRLKREWQEVCSNCEFKISSLSVPALPPQLIGQRWVIVNNTRRPKGSFSRQIRFDNSSKAIWVTGHVEVFQEVPVTLKPISFQQRLSKSDISKKRMNVTYATDQPAEISELIGRRLRKGMAAGEIIMQSQVLREKAFRRGDLVKMQSMGQGWAIGILGKALQDGHIGDTVQLENIKSKKVVTGKVTAQGEVLIQ